MTCREYINRRPRRAVLGMLLGFLLAAVGTLEAGTLWRAANPLATTIKRAEVSADGRWLTITAASDTAVVCLRQTSHILYQDKPGELRTFIMLGSAVNGLGLREFVPEYRVKIALPPGLAGDWNYLLRSFYSCPPFGLVRGANTATPDVVVHLGEGSE